MVSRMRFVSVYGINCDFISFKPLYVKKFMKLCIQDYIFVNSVMDIDRSYRPHLVH